MSHQQRRVFCINTHTRGAEDSPDDEHVADDGLRSCDACSCAGGNLRNTECSGEAEHRTL